jgi:hypothetical protein
MRLQRGEVLALVALGLVVFYAAVMLAAIVTAGR